MASRQPFPVHSLEQPISHLTRLRELRSEFCREQDPVKRQQILDELLLLIEERWRHLLGLIAEEHNPLQLRAMIMELNAILQERRKELEKPSEIADSPPASAKSNDEPR